MDLTRQVLATLLIRCSSAAVCRSIRDRLTKFEQSLAGLEQAKILGTRQVAGQARFLPKTNLGIDLKSQDEDDTTFAMC